MQILSDAGIWLVRFWNIGCTVYVHVIAQLQLLELVIE